MLLYKTLARSIPGLPLKLRQAKLPDTPEYYVQKTVAAAVLTSLGGVLIVFLFARSPIAAVLLPFFLIFSFFYYLRRADIRIKKIQNQINTEIVFAGRFLIIELESGVPIYAAFSNVAHNYEHIGPYFAEIVERIDLGTTIDEAISETINVTPSADLRKVLWQLLNSMKTGADVNRTLSSAIDHIVREQKIQIAEYGRKLNPLAMFYMMIAVILPSLGVVFLSVLATFLGLPLSLPVLLLVSLFLALLQFIFMAVIKSSRPAVEL